MLPEGLPVKVQYEWGFHHGLADGLGHVIHCSKAQGMVTRVSEADFADGRVIEVSKFQVIDGRGAVETALRYIGAPYHLFNFNCEMFVLLCLGLVPESPQIQRYLISTAGLGTVALSGNKYLKLLGGVATLAAWVAPEDESPVGTVLTALAVTGMLCVALS